MPSVDLKYVQHRHREITAIIDKAAPALVYSGTVGIVIIAPARNATRPRIRKVLDRLAVVPRGDINAGRRLHQATAATGYIRAREVSTGGVSGMDLVRAASQLLGEKYHAVLAQPQAVEACIVQVHAVPEEDILTYIGPSGSTEMFDQIYYMGQDRDTVNGQLRSAWRDFESMTGLLTYLHDQPALTSLFATGIRRDVVFLDRAAVRRHAYDQVFQRISA